MINPTSEVNPNEINNIPESYLPIIHKIDVKDKKLQKIEPDFASHIAYPLISFGFQQYLHANVEKMEIIKEFAGKKKVYSTMRLFNSTIDNYDTDINAVSNEYFLFNEKENILGNGFYKLWEIMAMFNIIPDETVSSLHLLESDASLVQSLILFREMFMKNTTKDKHYVIPMNKLQSEATSFISGNKKISLLKTTDNFDITEASTIKTIVKNIPKKINLVTAYGAPDWKYKITLEQEMTDILIGEIITALNILSDGGSFVCRVFETFTMPVNKLIFMLSSVFDEVYLVKPLLSHMSTSEKFLVCLNYKSKKQILEQLEVLLKDMNKNTKLNIVDIFPDLELPTEFITTMININTQIANKQSLAINKIVKFIKSQNYYGDMYIYGRDEQIIASKYWLNQYYPTKKEFTKMQKNLEKLKQQIIKH